MTNKHLRKERFNDKIAFIRSKLTSIPVLPEDDKFDIILDSILYKIQTSIEGTIDLVIMLTSDLGHIVKDDYTNIDNLVINGIIEKEIGKGLSKLNGLRNAIVHRYNGLSKEVIIESIPFIKEIITKFLLVIENTINTSDQYS